MKTLPLAAAAAAVFTLVMHAAGQVPEPKFRAVTIDDKIQIGYGVAVSDVDGDKLPDILLADKKQFVWYRNPGKSKAGLPESSPQPWDKFVMAENLTVQDNVCIAAQDIDDDGKCEVAVGAGWNPSDTEKSGAVFYLIPPADRTQRWDPVKLHAEPTTHRMRWAHLSEVSYTPARVEHATQSFTPPAADSRGPPDWALIVLPLHGRGNKNGEGAPVKVLAYRRPADPRAEWKTQVVHESMHMTHNFAKHQEGRKLTLLIAGKEGIGTSTFVPSRPEEGWTTKPLLDASGTPAAKGGAGEVKLGSLSKDRSFIATVEPMHGNRLETYVIDLPPPGQQTFEWKTRQLTDGLTEGHALACGEFLGIQSDQIVVGWRGSKPEKKAGIALWTPLDAQGEKWRESVVDDGGMACEDLQLADLNGDGTLDIIASGRATKNLKIYFNETVR